MKNLVTLVIFLSSTYFSFSQLISGTLVDAQRQMLSKYDFKITDNFKGVKYFKLAVNNEGIVTNVVEEIQETSFVSTPAKLIAMRELATLKFEQGTHYPKFHHVLVKVEYFKKD